MALENGASTSRTCPSTSLLTPRPSLCTAWLTTASDGNQPKTQDHISTFFKAFPLKSWKQPVPNPTPQRCLMNFSLLSSACEGRDVITAGFASRFQPLLPQLHTRSRRGHAPYCTKAALLCGVFAAICCGCGHCSHSKHILASSST